MRTTLSVFAARLKNALSSSLRRSGLLLSPGRIAGLLALGTLICFAQPAPAQYTGQGALTGSGVVAGKILRGIVRGRQHRIVWWPR